MRVAKAAVTWLGVAFAAIQIIPAARSNPPEASAPTAPVAIVALLKRACYDCHSNRTRWPWYSYVAPASWVVSRHVIDARRRLNFSEWEAYASDPDTAAHKLAEIADPVSKGEMAPRYYRMMHPAAQLNRVEREELVRWARASSAATRSSD
jgi:hypothetical protein